MAVTERAVQKAADAICKKYGVPSVSIRVTNRGAKGAACYNTYRVRVGGKVGKTHHPKCIDVFNWDAIKGSPGEVAYRLGHELAHHIRNMKANSLAHNQAFYRLEESVSRELARRLK